MGSAWNLVKVKITVNNEKTFRFYANRWLDPANGDKKTRIDLFPDEKEELRKEEPKKEEPKNPALISINATIPTVSITASHTYDIEVKTASEFGSGN